MQINWKLKSFMYHVFEVLPQGDRLYYLFQNKITRSVWVNDEQFRVDYKGKVQRHFDAIEKYGEKDIESSTFFEFGAGWDMRTPVGFAVRGEGIKRYIAVDLNRYAHPELLKNTICLYNRNKEIINSEYGHGAIDRTIDMQDGDPLELLRSRYKIEYYAPMDAGSTPFEDGSVDYVISNVSLEHIPREDIERIFRECYRLLSPGGLMSLSIDYTDHYAHSDPTISVFNYMKYSEQEWKRYNTPTYYQNRLQNSDYKKLLEQNGFQIIENIKTSNKDDVKVLRSIQISDRFKKYDEDDLLIRSGLFIVRKPAR